MRSGFLALILCAHLTALCQSAKPAPAESGKAQQAPQPWTACSLFSAQTSSPCAAPQANPLPFGSATARLWNAPPIDASHLFASPLLGSGAQLQRPLIARNEPLAVSQLPGAQWPRAKCEPIPTQWPDAKLEKIPTQWPHLSMLPVENQPTLSVSVQRPAK
jgi:hypothetical protein